MMGFGLIRLLIAERRKKQSTKKQSRAATISRLLENQILRAIFLMFAGRTTGVMGHNPRWMGGTGCGCASYSTLQTDSSRYGQKLRDANEIVGDRSQDTRPKSSMWRAIKPTNTRGDSFRRPAQDGRPLSIERSDSIDHCFASPLRRKVCATHYCLRRILRSSQLVGASNCSAASAMSWQHHLLVGGKRQKEAKSGKCLFGLH
jgi:hypothetical protein